MNFPRFNKMQNLNMVLRAPIYLQYTPKESAHRSLSWASCALTCTMHIGTLCIDLTDCWIFSQPFMGFPHLGVTSAVQCRLRQYMTCESEDWWSIFWSLIVVSLRAKHIFSFLPPQDRKPLIISLLILAAYSIFASFWVNYNHSTKSSGSFLYYILWSPRLRVITCVKLNDNPSICRWCFHTVSLASLSGSHSCGGGGSHQYHTLTLFGNTLVATSRATQSQPIAKRDHSNPNDSHTLLNWVSPKQE